MADQSFQLNFRLTLRNPENVNAIQDLLAENIPGIPLSHNPNTYEIDGTVTGSSINEVGNAFQQFLTQHNIANNFVAEITQQPHNVEDAREATLSIDPQTKIHNDSAQSSDRLNRLLYANAISQEIESIPPPMTIGILANWGSGKTQLLLQIKDAFKEQIKFYGKSKICVPYLALAFFASIVVTILFTILCVGNRCMIISCGHNSSETNQTCYTTTEQHDLGINEWGNLALALLFILIFFISFAVLDKLCFKFLIDPRILCYAVFAQFFQSHEELTEKKDDSTSSTKDKRYIFVDFNAWEYAGSDNLWAAIVINLATAIEKEFGVVTSRLFRLIGFQMKQNKESCRTLEVKFHCLKRNPDESIKKLMKTFGNVKNLTKSKSLNQESSDVWEIEFSKREEMKRAFRALDGKNNIMVTKKCENEYRCLTFCLEFLKRCCCRAGSWILLILFFVAFIIVYIFVATFFKSILKKFTQVSQLFAIMVVWIPCAVGFIYKIMNIILVVRQSHTKTINEALKGTKTNMAEQLGFMHKVKEEVQLMTEIVRCAESVYNRKYRIVITIDDLDRVGLNKVKSVLDAVNILLSDKNSPFVCLIAVDSRIAVKSIKENMKSSLVQSNVTGSEYLKKIINLPFCLPEISDEDKKQFIDGLLAWTIKKKIKVVRPVIRRLIHHKPWSQTEPGPSKKNSSNSKLPLYKPKTDDESIQINHENFIEECQEFLSNDPTTLSYLDGNPRNIKRIYNILCLTLRVIQCIKEEREREALIREIFSENDRRQSSDDPSSFLLTKEISRDLVTWVILTEQWPYSMSYILHVIAKNELQIHNELHLLDIYRNHVQPKLSALTQDYNKDEALVQDRNQDDLLNYLNKLKEDGKTELNKKNVNTFKKITINLDQSYMQIVQRHSNLVTRRQMMNMATQIPSQL